MIEVTVKVPGVLAGTYSTVTCRGEVLPEQKWTKGCLRITHDRADMGVKERVIPESWIISKKEI